MQKIYFLSMLLLSVCAALRSPVFAQGSASAPSLQTSALQLTTQQYFSIIIQNEGKEIKTYDPFPEIAGFHKQQQSSSVQMQSANGRLSYKHSITQHYLPKKAGKYSVPALQMRVNGRRVTHPAFEVVVTGTQSVPHKPSFSRSPFDQFFDVLREPKKEEFVEVEDEAFLALSTHKNEVFVGEDLTVTLALYVAGSNRAALEFYKLNEQLPEITRKVKPKGCWEEGFPIQRIEQERISLQGKPYSRMVLYRSTFYPLQDSVLVFPAVGLKMLKYKVSTTSSIWGRRRQPAYKTFYTKKKVVPVKPLPPHPLREQAAVGRYRLAQEPKSKTLRTGQGLNYKFTIVGEGNISAIPPPMLREVPGLQLYPPQIQQQVHRSQGRVFGQKQFIYHILPQEVGNYPLSESLYWVYFDPMRLRYDTLLPRMRLQVSGKSIRNLQISNNQEDPFYRDMLAKAPHSISIIRKWRHWAAAGVIFVLIASISALIFRRAM